MEEPLDRLLQYSRLVGCMNGVLKLEGHASARIVEACKQAIEAFESNSDPVVAAITVLYPDN